jgi:hypothetical protein
MLKQLLLFALALGLAPPTLAKQQYYLIYSTPTSKEVVYGPMKTLQECQEDMARFQAKFKNIINPRCVRR